MSEQRGADRHRTEMERPEEKIPAPILDAVARVARTANGKTLIPNLNRGELGDTVRSFDGYYANPNNVPDGETYRDFWGEVIAEPYDTIVLFPYGGMLNSGAVRNAETQYFERVLPLLKSNGLLIAIVRNQFLSARAYFDIRERIRNQFSVEAVVDFGEYLFRNISYSLLIIRNRRQASEVYMAHFQEEANAISNYLRECGKGWIDASKLLDRFDVATYDSAYSDIYAALQDPDLVRLHEVAEVFTGASRQMQTENTGDPHWLIRARDIFSGSIYSGRDRQKIWLSSAEESRYILRAGDILVNLLDAPYWAVFSGTEPSVADQNTAIIRAKKGKEDVLRLFFSSDIGVRYFEEQLKYFIHRGNAGRISLLDLRIVAIPDERVYANAAKIAKAQGYENKVAVLFESVGWQVERDVRVENMFFDIVLKKNGEIKGVVDAKRYMRSELREDTDLIEKLKRWEQGLPNAKIFLFVEKDICVYKSGYATSLSKIPRPNDMPETMEVGYARTGSIELQQPNAGSVSIEMLMEGLRRVETTVSVMRAETKSGLDEMKDLLHGIADQLSGYQALISRQLEMDLSEDVKEQLIHAFSSECVDALAERLRGETADSEYEEERQKLELSLGEDAWGKLGKESKSFLTTAKVLFRHLSRTSGYGDYSGVCLLATKALEVELKKRFYTEFICFLEKGTGICRECLGKEGPACKREPQDYPPALLKGKKVLAESSFTLGSVAYVLCFKKSDNDEINKCNKAFLKAYCKKHLMKKYDDPEQALNELMALGGDIEKVRNEYRNPSAHTNALQMDAAQGCFDLLLDVEKLLRTMLEKFDF